MTEVHPPVRGVVEFDAIRVYFGETLHIDLRRRSYRGLQTWIYPGNYIIEFSMADSLPMRVEYTDVARFAAVVKALAGLPLNGE
jgi:hypothetical protein